MAGQGRKPAPAAFQLIKGERKDRMNLDPPIPESGIPKCPSSVPAVKEVWDYTVDQLRKMQVITMADRDVLLAYCEAVVIHREASQLLARDGLLTESRMRGLTAHPAVRLQRDAAAAIKALGAEFGLTPASRTRVKVADQTPAKGQGAGRLLSG